MGVETSAKRLDGWNGGRPGVRLKTEPGAGEEPEDHKRPTFLIKLLLPRVQESLAAKLECCEIHERI